MLWHCPGAPLSNEEPYNPLAKTNLGESVAVALLRVPVRPLSDTAGLVGAGIYALYYAGSFLPYAAITARNTGGRFEQPIYVGKAVPKGARKGGLTLDAATGTALRDRLRQHASSIRESNLDLADFYYRALTVDDVWIPLGENMAIEKFQPLWNRVIDGFGNKTPGKGRGNQATSHWDTLHPGRKYVQKLALPPNPLSPEDIAKRVQDFYAGRLAATELLTGESEPVEDEGEW